jgi:hypothetical protein
VQGRRLPGLAILNQRVKAIFRQDAAPIPVRAGARSRLSVAGASLRAVPVMVLCRLFGLGSPWAFWRWVGVVFEPKEAAA